MRPQHSATSPAAYQQQGDYLKALDYYKQALPLIRKAGDRRAETQTLSNIGLLYESLSDYQKAIDYFNQALALCRQIGDRAKVGECLITSAHSTIP